MNRPYWHDRPIGSPNAPAPVGPGQPEESLVADARAGLTPADMVDGRLLHLLHRAPRAEPTRGRNHVSNL